MALTDLAAVVDQIQKYWSPIFTKALRENLMLAGLVNKQYEGAIAAQGDTVRVSQVVDMTGELLTVGTNANTFASEALSTLKIDIKADKRAVAAVEFDDLVQLQSQIDQNQVRDSMLYAMNKQINDYLWSLVAPSSATPDHELGSVSAIDAAELGAIRTLSGQALWLQDNSWFGLISPGYWGPMLADSTLSSSLYTDDAPIMNGQKARRLMSYSCYEDNSQTGNVALFAHPDFMHYVQQTSVQVKISDLHAQKRFGYVMSVDLVFGALLGIGGDVKHIRVKST